MFKQVFKTLALIAVTTCSLSANAGLLVHQDINMTVDSVGENNLFGIDSTFSGNIGYIEYDSQAEEIWNGLSASTDSLFKLVLNIGTETYNADSDYWGGFGPTFFGMPSSYVHEVFAVADFNPIDGILGLTGQIVDDPIHYDNPGKIVDMDWNSITGYSSMAAWEHANDLNAALPEFSATLSFGRVQVPEPSMLFIFIVGLMALTLRQRRLDM